MGRGNKISTCHASGRPTLHQIVACPRWRNIKAPKSNFSPWSGSCINATALAELAGASACREYAWIIMTDGAQLIEFWSTGSRQKWSCASAGVLILLAGAACGTLRVGMQFAYSPRSCDVSNDLWRGSVTPGCSLALQTHRKSNNSHKVTYIDSQASNPLGISERSFKFYYKKRVLKLKLLKIFIYPQEFGKW